MEVEEDQLLWGDHLRSLCAVSAGGFKLVFVCVDDTTHLLHMVVQLVEEDELVWDDGSKNPEYCIDEHSGHYFGKVRNQAPPTIPSTASRACRSCILHVTSYACTSMAQSLEHGSQASI